ncbi:hypothetical protein Cgig2_000199 [Carnegiea gigantea]|uniref:Uncharacterized protein n=1 Tax=Carnegiea gigantea TaxID=171969 RepID=A0A9Q1QKQ7_9CARY|nr:hypothetical protein Cgig2_000199 [Carnegiea gigantea]
MYRVLSRALAGYRILLDFLASNLHHFTSHQHLVGLKVNHPPSALQSLSSHSTRSQQSIPEKCTDQVEVPIDSEELKQLSASRWSSPCSFSSENDRTLFAESIGQEFHLSSTHYIDRLLFLTSNWQHSNSNNDDEIVDLMEPRLETFCVGNGQ